MTAFDRLLVDAHGAPTGLARSYLILLWLAGVAAPWYLAHALIRAEPANLVLAFLGAMIGAAKAVNYYHRRMMQAKRRYEASQPSSPESVHDAGAAAERPD